MPYYCYLLVSNIYTIQKNNYFLGNNIVAPILAIIVHDDLIISVVKKERKYFDMLVVAYTE